MKLEKVVWFILLYLTVYFLSHIFYTYPLGLINSKLIDNLKLSKKCRVLIVYLLIFYMVTAVIKNNFIYIIN